MGTLTYSTQRTNDRATPQVINRGSMQKWIIPWYYTVADTALVTTDVVELCKVPAGCRLLLTESYMKLRAEQSASTHMDIGYAEYKKYDGTTVTGNADGIIDGYDSSSTTMNLLSSSTLGTEANDDGNYAIVDFSDAVESVTITATCLNAGGTFDGDIGDIYQGYFTVLMKG